MLQVEGMWCVEYHKCADGVYCHNNSTFMTRVGAEANARFEQLCSEHMGTLGEHEFITLSSQARNRLRCNATGIHANQYADFYLVVTPEDEAVQEVFNNIGDYTG